MEKIKEVIKYTTKPTIYSMNNILWKNWHKHLDECDHCRTGNRCDTGAYLLEKADNQK